MTIKQSWKHRHELEAADIDARVDEKLARFKKELKTEIMLEFRDMLDTLLSKIETAAANETSSAKVGSSSSSSKAGPVTEDEIRAVLLQKAPVTTSDLVAKFKARLKSQEDKKAFADILRRISKIQKTNGPSNYVVLRDK